MDQLQSSLGEIIRRVEIGDSAAEQRLWDTFFEKLLRYVEYRVRQSGTPLGLVDEEAVALSALESVFKCAKLGRLQNVQDWNELSRLLFAMTNRKFVDHWRRATAQYAYPQTRIVSLSQDCIDIPDTEVAACTIMFEELLSRLMDLLPDDDDDIYARIAVFKLAGYTLAEISIDINRSVPTVNRKWAIIRRIWADELGE